MTARTTERGARASAPYRPRVGWVVSEGMLRDVDLVEVLAEELELLSPAPTCAGVISPSDMENLDKVRLARQEADKTRLARQDADKTRSVEDGDALSWLVAELADRIDGLCPPGLRFGASEGDGALFGYWAIDDPEGV